MTRKSLLIVLCAVLVLLLSVLIKENNSSIPPSVRKASTIDSKSTTVGGRSTRARHSSDIEHTETDLQSPAEEARMKRMAENLLKPPLDLAPTTAAEMRSQWLARYKKERDPLLRQEIITEMPKLDDPLTIKLMTDLLASEKNSGVRQQIVLILGYMHTAMAELPNISPAVMATYLQATDTEERARILDVMSNWPDEESMKFLQTAFFANTSTAEDRFNAAKGLFSLAPRVKTDPRLLQEVTDRLKVAAKSATSDEERLMAARALAAPGQDNKVFLRELLASESNPKVLKFLTLASKEFPTQ